MCGIAGFICNSSTAARLGRVPQVFESLHHRGPDDGGYLVFSKTLGVERGREWRPRTDEPKVVLLHRRLSIIDLTESGWQPMSTRDGRYHLVFNGEIYNYLELRRELTLLGHKFRTNSDTEVLLEAIAEWELEALTRLVGMFAFAFLDTTERTLTLVRDFFGIKPLYYATSGVLAFASEIKALLSLGVVSRKVDPNVAYRCLRFGVCDYGADTMLRDVAQLPPAHYLRIQIDHPDRRELTRYWAPEIAENCDLSFDEAAIAVRDMFIENVELHLRSDVPIGTALSGGIDSSSIVMIIRALEPALELKTFSFIADDSAVSEEKWVDIVGHRARAEVYKVHATAEELVRDLDLLTWVQDQPIAGSSPYAQYRVFQRAQQAGIKVMIDGQGADEILGGYRYYLAARIASLIRHHRWLGAYELLTACSHLPGGPSAAWIAMRTVGYLTPELLQPTMRKLGGQDLMPAWLNQSWFSRNNVYPQAIASTDKADVLRHTLIQELTEVSIPQLLRYEDRNSMAFSIESRVPFLTPKLVNFVLSLPEHYIIARDGTTKAVFRRAMRGIVPDEILDRRDKIGFATPERGWLSTVQPWVNSVLNSDAAAETLPLNRNALTAEWQQVSTGQIPFRSQLWRALNLIKWTEQFGARYS